MLLKASKSQCSSIRRLGVISNQISWFDICAGHMNYIVMKASTKRGLSSQGLCSRVRIPLSSPSQRLGLNFWTILTIETLGGPKMD